MTLRLVAAAASFGRDLDFGVLRALSLIEASRRDGADLLVLPHAVLGGYLDDLVDDADGGPEGAAAPPPDLPPAIDLEHPVFVELAAAAGALTVCLGFTEAVALESSGLPRRANTAVCLSGDGVLGVHRKVHLPPGERRWYEAGTQLAAFDTPVGRLGMLIDYDKTFPEAARALALDGARILAFVAAWPMSRTQPADRVANDRQSVLFDLYDRARAAENQVVVVSANQSGSQGRLRFLAQAKVVLPDGSVVARTGYRQGLAAADVDVDGVVEVARRRQHHLAERAPAAYGPR